MLILRICIAAVILGSVGLRYKTVSIREMTAANFDISKAAYQLVLASGAEMHENPVLPPKILASVVYFREAGCEAVGFALPIGIRVDMKTHLFRVDKPGFSHVIHYFDKTWSSQDRIAQRIVWLHEYALTILGLSDNFISQDAIVVGGPRECLDRSRIDWPSVWRQQNSSNIKTVGEKLRTDHRVRI